MLASGQASIFPDAFAQKNCLTTVVEGGSSGRRNFEKFKRTFVDRARTRVFVFLNIGGYGMTGEEHEQNVEYMDAATAAAMAKAHRDTIVGIKVAHYRGPDWRPLEGGVEAGTAANIPVMIDLVSSGPSGRFRNSC
jgi:dihydroorotase